MNGQTDGQTDVRRTTANQKGLLEPLITSFNGFNVYVELLAKLLILIHIYIKI